MIDANILAQFKAGKIDQAALLALIEKAAPKTKFEAAASMWNGNAMVSVSGDGFRAKSVSANLLAACLENAEAVKAAIASAKALKDAEKAAKSS